MGKFEYFFGWRKTNGELYPVRWVEENGVPVGGIFATVDKWKITREEFLSKTSELAVKYPCKEDTKETE